MKRTLTILLALLMLLSLAACGGKDAGPSGSASEEAPSAPAAAETPDGMTELKMENHPFGLTATVFLPELEGAEWAVRDEKFDAPSASLTGYYTFEEKGNIEVTVYLYPHSEQQKESEMGQDGYEPFENNNGYDAVLRITNDYDLRSDNRLFGGAIADGSVFLCIQCTVRSDDFTQDDLEALATDIGKYAFIGEADPSALVADDGGMQYPYWDISAPKEAPIGDDAAEIVQYLSGSRLEYQSLFTSGGLNFKLYTWDVLPASSFEGYHEGRDDSFACEIAGRPAKVYVGMAYGGLDSEALVQLDEDHYLRIDIRGDGYLDGEDVLDGMDISEYSRDLVSAEKIDATREMFRGFYDAFVSALTIN